MATKGVRLMDKNTLIYIGIIVSILILLGSIFAIMKVGSDADDLVEKQKEKKDNED